MSKCSVCAYYKHAMRVNTGEAAETYRRLHAAHLEVALSQKAAYARSAKRAEEEFPRTIKLTLDGQSGCSYYFPHEGPGGPEQKSKTITDVTRHLKVSQKGEGQGERSFIAVRFGRRPDMSGSADVPRQAKTPRDAPKPDMS